jgi:phosphopantothenoylcysteine decarboxylase/phosphopantothenate--cysteine ligase
MQQPKQILKPYKAGVTWCMNPDSGHLACGTTGAGRLPEVPEIIAFLDNYLASQTGDMRGFKVLVTAAGTREPIDPVRYVGNRSSGKMGYAIACAAARGAKVTWSFPDPVLLKARLNVTTINVETTQQMLDACNKAYPDVDVVIMAAAVADYRPRDVATQKIKKQNEDALTVVMDKNPDILSTLGARKNTPVPGGFCC